MAFAIGLSVSAGEIVSTNLPPPAAVKVDFDRDIQPIFQETCLRCHGPLKPKSHFRLDDRALALTGGDDNTNDIVPGDSGDSWLIHYVARQVTDMEMPPPDRGAPLTPRQIALLRAWIDQGANWSATNQPGELAMRFAPTLRWIGVSGNAAKFRELEGRREGFGGGVEDVLFSQQTGPNEKMTVEGHVIVPDNDYRLKLALDETDRGFVHAGFAEWRKYYNDVGGYDPAVAPPEFNFNRDLYVDNGRIWADFGLTLPRWPQIVLGYEYQFRQGNKSMLDWGGAGGGGVNIAPSVKAIDEQTHIVKLDITHDFAGWHLEDNARIEIYTEKNRSFETNAFNATGGTETQDRYHHVQGMNTIMLEKQIRDWWFLSGGFYYSRLEASDFFNQTNGAFGLAWSSAEITLRRESEIFSLASLFTPFKDLNVSLGTQNEWTREEGFGDAPDFEFFIPNAFESSSLDKFKAAQDADLRFTKIPFTVLFASARVEEEDDDVFQEEQPTGALTRRTDAVNDRYDVRTGFSTSPWRWSELSAEYRRRESDTDYRQFQDVFGNGFNAPTNGYPGFILARRILTDEFETKLVLRPANWIKTTLSYQISATDYSTKTDPAFDPNADAIISPGGEILAGQYDAHTYGLGVTLTPFQRLYFSGDFTYSDSRLITANNGTPSVVPYEGDVYTVLTTATYALNSKTSLLASYNFSRADYSQNNTAGVPLGIEFTRHQLLVGLTRRFTERLSGSLRYSFSEYAEPTSGGLNNFTAHGIFALLDYRWP